MTERDDERTPGFNAPLAESGPIVSKRTGPRRARVQGALGAPQKMIPLRRSSERSADVVDTHDYLDDMEVGAARSPYRGIAITLLILLLLGTRGCGLLDSGGDSDEPSVPTSTTEPQLVQRLPAPPGTTIVSRGDDTSNE